MAIINNLILRNARKKLAGTVVYSSNGQTIMREAATSVSNPRTESQMSQRVRWANLVNFYRVAKPMMKYAFENKKRTQSDYNALMSANVTTSPIALTKQEAAAGACVVAPYTITQGSLPSVEVNAVNIGWATSIVTNPDVELETCTIADFSAALLELNPGLKDGDQLSFVRFTQSVNGATGVPYVILRKYELILSRANADLVANFMPVDIVTNVEYGDGAALGVTNNGGTGAWAFIVSRTIGGRTQVSSQQLVMVNMDATLEAYSSEAQIAAAVKSYGESEDAFLSTTSANYAQAQPIQYTIISAEWDGRTMFPQSYAGNAPEFVSKRIVLEFNQPLKGTVDTVKIYDWDDKSTAQNFAVDGSKVIIPLAKWTAGETHRGIRSFEVRVGDTFYQIWFQIQQGGLE